MQHPQFALHKRHLSTHLSVLLNDNLMYKKIVSAATYVYLVRGSLQCIYASLRVHLRNPKVLRTFYAAEPSP